MYSAKYFHGDSPHMIEAEAREDLVLALKDVGPGSIYWIKDGTNVLEGGEKWSILAEARELRLRQGKTSN
jgi:hypothetical protein